jgi:hypothetical protein
MSYLNFSTDLEEFSMPSYDLYAEGLGNLYGHRYAYYGEGEGSGEVCDGEPKEGYAYSFGDEFGEGHGDGEVFGTGDGNG